MGVQGGQEGSSWRCLPKCGSGKKIMDWGGVDGKPEAERCLLSVQAQGLR